MKYLSNDMSTLKKASRDWALNTATFICLLTTVPVLSHAEETSTTEVNDVTQWVDPFIGTGGDGHTFPGAVVPFGMVQLSPDTAAVSRGVDPQSEIYKHSAGYHYDDKTITGFSHTHFSGTGHSDLGDLLIMPMTGKAHTEPGSETDPDSGYRSRFNHNAELASPGYYSVELSDYNVKAELTTTARTGMHRYTFKENERAHVLLDLSASIYNFKNKVIWSDVRVIDNQTLLAYRSTNGWAKQREMYFAIKFSRPFDSIELINQDNSRYRCNGCLTKKGSKPSTIVNSAIQYTAGKTVKVLTHFKEANAEPLIVKVGLSAVNRKNALENLMTENPDWDFDNVKLQAKKDWQKQLSVVQARGKALKNASCIRRFTMLYRHLLFIKMLMVNIVVLMVKYIKQTVLKIIPYFLYGTPTAHFTHY